MAHNKNYIRDIINDYCVIDLETTGFSFDYDQVIEIGILKVRNNEIIDSYNNLVNPNKKIPSLVTELTGITNEMVMNQPEINDIADEIIKFIGDDIILGHNTSFDLNFLAKGLGYKLPNKYMDTLQFSRKLYPELKQHRLSDLASHLKLTRNNHRSLSDCNCTKELYDAIKENMFVNNLQIKDLFKSKKSNSKSLNIKNIVPTSDEIDEENFFFERHCVFTGVLEKMLRKDAMQLVVNVGGILDNSVTKQTNYLILGNNDYCKAIKDGKSSKHKKAEKLKIEGQDIEIIDESTFFSLITNE